jgi:predicted DCC family thiol-disulfide oxidoreductase YuxK
MKKIPHASGENKPTIVLFDGECGLCTGWMKRIARADRRGVFTMHPFQSTEARAILRRLGRADTVAETMLAVHGVEALAGSDAFLYVMRRLPFPWKLLGIARFVPKSLRDLVYGLVARNRYRISGTCACCGATAAVSVERPGMRRRQGPT